MALLATVLFASVVVQFTAACLAARLIGITGRIWAWILVSAALFLMAVRRCITLFDLLSQTGHSARTPELTAELTALAISACMLGGVALVAPIFKSLFQASRQLERERDFINNLVRTLPAFFVAIRRDGSIMMMNNAMLQALGYSEEEVIGADYVQKLVPEEDREKVVRAFEHLARLGSPIREENRVVSRDGRQFLVEWHARPVLGRRGHMEFFFGVGIDHTEREAAERQLRHLATVIEQAAESVTIMDADGRIQYVNPAFEQISGYGQGEAVGRNRDFLYDSTGDVPDQVRAHMAAGRVWRGRIRNRKKGDEVYVLDATVSPVRDPEGRVVSFVEVGDDATGRLVLEAQLRQAQKMEAVGRLAGGIAHDFNNILTAILGHAEALRALTEKEAPGRRNVDRIHDAGRKAAELTRKLLVFSRKQMVEPQVVQLADVVTGMESLLRRALGEDIGLDVSLAADLRPVEADPTLLDQVLMNLSLNARDAMDEGGHLKIRATNRFLDREKRGTDFVLPPGQYIRLSVEDTGCGMTPEVAAQVFEPFFTTKEPGKGTGLGLSIVYGVVRGAGGHISVTTRPGRGTTFVILLPAAERPVTVTRHRTVPIPSRGTGEFVLVVEDEPSVRELAREILEDWGYRVVDAGSGDEALRLVEGLDRPLDLLLTDVVMPGMSGRELAEDLCRRNFDLGVVYMSGYTDDVVLSRGVLPHGVLFLQKPFSSSALLSKVQQGLEGPRGPDRIPAEQSEPAP